MMMKKYCECLILLLLVTFTTGREDRTNFNELLQEEMETRRREDNLYNELKRRILLLLERSSSVRTYSEESMLNPSDSKTPLDVPNNWSSTSTQPTTTTTVTIVEPIRVAIFNSGTYSVYLSLSYTIDNETVEQAHGELQIPPGEQRSSFLPYLAINARILVIRYDSLAISYVVDERMANLNNTSDRCYLIAGTRRHPVYGVCPSSFGSMLNAWLG